MPSFNDFVGYLTVGQEMTVQFWFTVNEECPDDWCSVLHVADADASYFPRLPGIYIDGTNKWFHVSMTDNFQNNNALDLEDFEVTADGEEHLFYFQYTADVRVYAIDGTELYREECPGTTSCSFNNSLYHGAQTVYLSDVWFTAMNMTIRDFRIYPSM